MRAVFELDDDAWGRRWRQVSETKRFTIDAGQRFYAVEHLHCTLSASPTRRARSANPRVSATNSPRSPPSAPRACDAMGQTARCRGPWRRHRPPGAQGYAEDAMNELILTKPSRACPALPPRGHGRWSGEVTTAEAWRAYVPGLPGSGGGAGEGCWLGRSGRVPLAVRLPLSSHDEHQSEQRPPARIPP